MELITKALELDEKCEFAYETLGTIEVQRGNLKRAIELFDKAIPLANTELEMGHLYGLRDAAQVGLTTILYSLSFVTLSLLIGSIRRKPKILSSYWLTCDFNPLAGPDHSELQAGDQPPAHGTLEDSQ